MEHPSECSDPRHEEIEEAATTLLVAVWRGIKQGFVPERSPIGDAALELRDRLNPNWPSDPDWLPEPLDHDCQASHPDIIT